MFELIVHFALAHPKVVLIGMHPSLSCVEKDAIEITVKLAVSVIMGCRYKH